MITETLKFVEDHTKAVFNDLQRVLLTLSLIYLAAPKSSETFYEKAISHFAYLSRSIQGVLLVGEKNEYNLNITNILIIWLAYQLVVTLHDAILILMHNLLPVVSVRIFKTTEDTAQYINQIKDFSFKYYEKALGREDFDILFSLYQNKNVAEISRDAYNDNPERLNYMKERLVIFCLGISLLRETEHYALDLAIIISIMVYGYMHENRRNFDGEAFNIKSVQQTALEMVSAKTDIEIDKTTRQGDGLCLASRWVVQSICGPVRLILFDRSLVWSIGTLAKGTMPLRSS